MAMEVGCRCGQRFLAEDHLAGRQVPCPACGQVLSIPVPPPVVAACVCGARFEARADLAGKQVPCPNCSRPLAIPLASQAASAAKGDPLWDDLPPPGTARKAAADFGPAPPAAMATARPAIQPRPKGGREFMPGEKTWELYYTLPIALVVAIGGLIMICASLSSMQSAIASSSWAGSTATITSAELIPRRGRYGRTWNDAKVAYVYTVDGKSYNGTRISFSAYGSSITGEEVVAKYAPGSQHPCYYDSARPAECVLEKGAYAFSFFFPVLALVVTAVGSVWAFRCGMSLWHRLS